jgi:hypothetical protein
MLQKLQDPRFKRPLVVVYYTLCFGIGIILALSVLLVAIELLSMMLDAISQLGLKIAQLYNSGDAITKVIILLVLLVILRLLLPPWRHTHKHD